MSKAQRRVFGFSALLTVVAVLVVACGGSNPTPTPHPTPTRVPTPTTEPTPTPPQGSDPLSVVQAFLSAINAGDPITALALMADDAAITGTQFPVDDPAAILQTFADLARSGSSLELSNLQTSGDTVTGDLKTDLPFAREAGLPPARGAVELVVREGKVVSFNIMFDEATRALLEPLFGRRATDLASDPQEQAYLVQLAAIGVGLNQLNSSIEEILRRSWPTRGLLFTTLGDADFSGAASIIVTGLAELDPPERFREEHGAYLQALRENATETNALIDQAIAGDDLQGVVLAQLQFEQRFFAPLLHTSREFCQALAPGQLAAVACQVEVPFGGYGAALRNILTRNFVEFGLRVANFPPAYSSEERYQTLQVVQPGIVAALETHGAEVKALMPPPELAQDHQVVARYFDETLATALAINEAAAAGDDLEIQRLFVHSGTVFCNAVNDLSPAIRPVLGPHISDNPIQPICR